LAENGERLQDHRRGSDMARAYTPRARSRRASTGTLRP